MLIHVVCNQAWFALLASYSPDVLRWRAALLQSDVVVRDRQWRPNAVAAAFAPRAGQIVQLL